jgi:hypothetical protein
MRSVLQGRSGFEASQLALAHVLLGAAEGKYLVQDAHGLQGGESDEM